MTQPTTNWQVPAEPAGPAPGLEFGGFGGRLVAYIIDVIIVSVVIVVLGVAATAVAVALDPVAGAFLFIFIVMLVSLAYFPWFWARGGATPGMKMLGLQVVRDRDGGPISWGQAILRLLGYWVSSFVFYLGFIWIFIDSRRRGWHDLIAGTVVVKRQG